MMQHTRHTPTNDGIEPGLSAFLQQKVNTFIKWDLIRFFHDNPHAASTVEDVARYTGREVWAIRDDMQQLANTGVLNQTEHSGRTIYTLAADDAMRSLIQKFVMACDDRSFRVKAINLVISSMR
jgi:hypothetical protein